jgi:hypothetical protein
MSPLLSFLKTTCLILTPLLVSTVLAQTPDPDLIASLDYGTFQGTYNAQYNISYYKKIPFAAPPTGENRFRAPQPPIPITNGTYDSDQTFDYCPQKTVGFLSTLFLSHYSLLSQNAHGWDKTKPPKLFGCLLVLIEVVQRF